MIEKTNPELEPRFLWCAERQLDAGAKAADLHRGQKNPKCSFRVLGLGV